ncbi:hypothetical protein ACFV5G_01920 [Streptomyces sp. NPDC059766]|uniref:hypothetical protein n=1 Tax=Streptomyces sp. NPDC059766 TaxID=3346940 RepID=UPI0036523C51
MGAGFFFYTPQHPENPTPPPRARGGAGFRPRAAAGRADAQFKGAYGHQVRAYLDLLTGLEDHPDSEEDRRDAMLTLSAMVGAVLMARAVDDPELSDELLTTVAAQLKQDRSRTTAQQSE